MFGSNEEEKICAIVALCFLGRLQQHCIVFWVALNSNAVEGDPKHNATTYSHASNVDASVAASCNVCKKHTFIMKVS